MSYRQSDFPPPSHWETAFWLLMSVLIVVLMLWLNGCAPPPRPENPTHAFDYCEADAIVSVGSVCDGQFTKHGLACVVCANVNECVDKKTVVYCAKSCFDPACEWRP